MIFKGIEITPEHIKNMREWVEDCQWADSIEDLTDTEIVNGVERHYCGGVSQFIED